MQLGGDPLTASLILMQHAKCLMYSGDFEKAALYACAAVQRREEEGVETEDLLQGLDECASILLSCGRADDCLRYLEEEIALLMGKNDVARARIPAHTLVELWADNLSEVERQTLRVGEGIEA